MKKLDLYVAASVRRYGVSVVFADPSREYAGEVQGKARDVWYGQFGTFDKAADGSLYGAEKALLGKAVWLGKQVAAGIGDPLTLNVWISSRIHCATVSQAREVARKGRVSLHVHESTRGNPADRLVRDVTGFMKVDKALAARAVVEYHVPSDK